MYLQSVRSTGKIRHSLAVVAWVQILFDQIAGLGKRRQSRVAMVVMLSGCVQLGLNSSKSFAYRLACTCMVGSCQRQCPLYKTAFLRHCGR